MTDSNSKNFTKSYLIALVAAGVLYIITCAPGVLWQDSGMFQYRIWNNDIEGGLGLALAHPLYLMIGIAAKYIPFGDFAYRVNLISALCAAITVANVFLLLRLWLKKKLPAAIGALTLALSWTFWQHGCIAEVYTLYTAFFTAELIFLLQYLKTKRPVYLYLLMFFNGLAIANHMWAIIPLACYGILIITLLVKKQIKITSLVLMAMLWIIGAGPYIFLIIKNMIATGDITATLSSAVFGNGYSDNVLNASISLRMMLENLAFIAYNFPTPNILLLFVGIGGLYKISKNKKFAHIILALVILFLIFAFRYKVPDRYAFFIPFYCLASILIGAGSHLFLKRYPKNAYAILILLLTTLSLPIYQFTPIVAEKLEIKMGTKRKISYRNDYTYFLRPWQMGNYAPKLFAADALAIVEDNAVIIADSTTFYAIWYLQTIKNNSKDVQIISSHKDCKSPTPFFTKDTIEQLMAESPVYVVSPAPGYCPDYLLDHYNFIKAGPIYRVIEQ